MPRDKERIFCRKIIQNNNWQLAKQWLRKRGKQREREGGGQGKEEECAHLRQQMNFCHCHVPFWPFRSEMRWTLRTNARKWDNNRSNNKSPEQCHIWKSFALVGITKNNGRTKATFSMPKVEYPFGFLCRTIFSRLVPYNGAEYYEYISLTKYKTGLYTRRSLLPIVPMVAICYGNSNFMKFNMHIINIYGNSPI